MLMPSIFGENLFDDDWMNFPFNDEFWGKKNPLYGKHGQNQRLRYAHLPGRRLYGYAGLQLLGT